MGEIRKEGAGAAADGVEESRRQSASQIANAFAQALLGGDATAAAGYFSAAGRCLTSDGTEISGRRAIAELFAQLTASENRLEIHSGRTLICEEVALCTQYWKRSSAKPSREGFRATSTARLVLARQSASWQIAIAAPWG